MPSDSEKRRFSWRGSRKNSAKLSILHAFRHICGIGGHTRTEKCLWQFSLQMHSNELYSRPWRIKAKQNVKIIRTVGSEVSVNSVCSFRSCPTNIFHWLSSEFRSYSSNVRSWMGLFLAPARW